MRTTHVKKNRIGGIAEIILAVDPLTVYHGQAHNTPVSGGGETPKDKGI